MAPPPSGMAAIEFDIATKIVPPDQKIWAMFPGTARKFFGIFAQEDVVFLDMPGLTLSARILEDNKLLRQHVAMSEAWAEYHYSGGGKVPSRRPDDYPVKKNRSFNSLVGNVRHVFADMKRGDLVLVGASTQYDPVLVGEIADSPFIPEKFVYFERYGRERIPARRVHWLRNNFERRHLSQGLSLLLSNRRAVITVPKTQFAEEVYQIAYGDYVAGEHSRYIYEGKKYKNIGLAILPGIKLISYFCAAFNACEIGEIEAFAALDIDGAIANYFEQDVLNSFEVDFRSPGEYVLRAKRAALPLFVAVLISASGSDISLTTARAAEVTNSATSTVVAPAPIQDECTLEVEEKYKAIMEALNTELFEKICELNKEAQQGVGLKVDVKQKKIKP